MHFRVASAENTGLDASSFDLVTAGQCWHWFDSVAAMVEVQRVLRPGGILAIAHYSYLAEHAPVARETEDLILKSNPSWSMAGSAAIVSLPGLDAQRWSRPSCSRASTSRTASASGMTFY